MAELTADEKSLVNTRLKKLKQPGEPAWTRESAAAPRSVANQALAQREARKVARLDAVTQADEQQAQTTQRQGRIEKLKLTYPHLTSDISRLDQAGESDAVIEANLRAKAAPGKDGDTGDLWGQGLQNLVRAGSSIFDMAQHINRVVSFGGKHKGITGGEYEAPDYGAVANSIRAAVDKMDVKQPSGYYAEPPEKLREYLLDPKRFAHLVATSAPTTAALAMTTVVAPATAIAAMFSIEGGQTAQTIREYEKETGQKLDSAQAALAPFVVGSINAALEKTGIDNILKASGASKSLRQAMTKVLFSAMVEGGTEATQETNQILSEMLTTNKLDSTWADRLVSSAVAGLGSGGALSVPGAAVGRAAGAREVAAEERFRAKQEQAIQAIREKATQGKPSDERSTPGPEVPGQEVIAQEPLAGAEGQGKTEGGPPAPTIGKLPLRIRTLPSPVDQSTPGGADEAKGGGEAAPSEIAPSVEEVPEQPTERLEVEPAPPVEVAAPEQAASNVIEPAVTPEPEIDLTGPGDTSPHQAEVEVDPGQYPVQRIPIKNIGVAPKEFQFKRDADEQGVVTPLEGKYDERLAGNILLYQKKDGKLWVVNGHHRLAKAKEVGETGINAQIIREADGVTPQQAFLEGAILNIRGGRGTVYDHAQFFRDNPDASMAELGKESALARRSYKLASESGEDLYTAFINENITPEQAFAIVEVAGKDPELQAAGLNAVQQDQEISKNELAENMRALVFMQANAAELAGTKQMDMFGTHDTAINTSMALTRIAKEEVSKLKQMQSALRLAATTGGAAKLQELQKRGLLKIGSLSEAKAELDRVNSELVKWERWQSDPDLRKIILDKLNNTEGIQEEMNLGNNPPRPPEPDMFSQETAQTNSKTKRPERNEVVHKALLEHFARGKSVVLATYAHATKLSKPGHIRVNSAGEFQVVRGRNWDTLLDDQVESLAKQAGMASPGAPSGAANAGKFSDIPKRPSGTADTGGYAGDRAGQRNRAEPTPEAMDLPEIVELARLLLSGKYPSVLKKLRGSPGIVGRFRPKGQGKIEVKADLARDPMQMAKTLAHEIGHLVDWLPDKTFARGNILGRIASLKKYMRHYLENRPGAPGPLTDADRARLREQARMLARENSEKLIDEEITRETPVTPDDILAIWNSATFDISKNDELYRYIQGLSSAEKKSIIKEAMKGVVPDELRRFARRVTERTGRKVRGVNYQPGAVEAEYKELIRQEIERRRLFHRDKVMKELMDLTDEWKPFDPDANRSYTKYRYSSVELYADAISALITNPGYLRDKAPLFYEGFFNYLDRKPAAKHVFERIQHEIKSGNAQKSLVLRTRAGFQKREDEYRLLLEKQNPGIWNKDAAGTFWIDKNFSILRRIKEVGESSLPASKNPRYYLEDLAYSSTESQGYLSDLHQKVIEPLRSGGLTAEDLGEYLFLKRVSTERAEIANPLGWTKERAIERLQEMDNTFGPVLAETSKAFREFRKEWFLSKVESADMFSPELTKTILEAENYVTFDIVGHMEKKFGRDGTAQIYHQVGTFTETGNPLTATIIKDVLLMRSINRNNAARVTVEFFQEHFPGEIKEADKKWNGQFHEVVESADKQLKLLGYMDKGEFKGFYVPKYVGEAFQQNPIESMWIAKALRVAWTPFRWVFTEYNPGFWAFNVWRDTKAASKQLPGMKLSTFIPKWLGALPAAYRIVGGRPDEIGKRMLKGKMLLSVVNYRENNPEDLQLERILKRYNVSSGLWNRTIGQRTRAILQSIANTGQALEYTTKIASYKALRKKHPILSEQELAHQVRSLGGSPDFARGGTGYGFYNYLLPFSNAMKEGWRSSFTAAKTSPGEYAWKTMKYNILPKLAMFVATTGLLGEGLRRVLERASEYDKTNYHIIPLGETPQGKGVYFRIPEDEMGRFVGGVFWKLMDQDKDKFMTGMFDYMSGQAPTVHPGLGVAVSTVEYLSGRNPYDHFRGREAIDEDVFLAGGARSHAAFAKWIANQVGAGIIHRFDTESIDPIKTDLEQLLDTPLASNLAGRFVKVTDYGLREQMNKDQHQLLQAAARDRLLIRDGLSKMLNGQESDLTEEELEAMSRKEASVDYQERKLLARKFGSVYEQRLATARSKEEKLMIFERMIKSEAESSTAANRIGELFAKIRNMSATGR